MNHEQNIELQELVAHISALPYVNAIFLFGSQVNRRAREDSDIDVAVLTQEVSHDEHWEIVGLGDDVFDIHIFSRLPPVIRFRILQEGKLLFVRDEQFLNRARLATLHEYNDFAAVLERFCRSVIAHG